MMSTWLPLTMFAYGSYWAPWGSRRNSGILLITSPGAGIGKINAVSDNVKAAKVIFKSLGRDELNEYLFKTRRITGELACWIWHVIGGKLGDLNDLLHSDVTKDSLLHLRRSVLRQKAFEAHTESLEVLEDPKHRFGDKMRACFEDVLLVLAARTQSIRNGTLSKMDCLQAEDLAPVLQHHGLGSNILQHFLNSGNVFTQHGMCYFFDSKYVEDFVLKAYLGEPYPNVEAVCNEESRKANTELDDRGAETKQTIEVDPLRARLTPAFSTPVKDAAEN
eukprot:gb/GECG01010854.1/.p1 GENE.gb/GECG01010854.1/~~gb/GECG01010854.1/.p1  ORF type:complete len:277 (+),score=28.33 gb/GECG01010854.1/:1-831(+)